MAQQVGFFSRIGLALSVLFDGRLAGLLVAGVIYVKSGEDRDFLIIDAAMNDLIRPAMYGAHHDNPSWMTEDADPRGCRSAFVTDKLDADRQVRALADRNPDCGVAVARMGALLGGSRTRNFWTKYFTRPVVATVLTSVVAIQEPTTAPLVAPIAMTGISRRPRSSLNRSAAKAQNWAMTNTPKIPTHR